MIPRVDPERRIPWRIGAVLLAYLVYLQIERRGGFAGALCVGAGIMLGAWAVIDRLTGSTAPGSREAIVLPGVAVLLIVAGVIVFRF